MLLQILTSGQDATDARCLCPELAGCDHHRAHRSQIRQTRWTSRAILTARWGGCPQPLDHYDRSAPADSALRHGLGQAGADQPRFTFGIRAGTLSGGSGLGRGRATSSSPAVAGLPIRFGIAGDYAMPLAVIMMLNLLLALFNLLPITPSMARPCSWACYRCTRPSASPSSRHVGVYAADPGHHHPDLRHPDLAVALLGALITGQLLPF